MALITSADYPSIRALIDISLAEAQLPGSVIGLDDFAGAASREVQAQTTEENAHSKLAARLICAALLVPVVPKLKSQSIPGGSFEREATDWSAHIQSLYDRAGLEISLAKGEDGQADIAASLPTMFTVAGAPRDC